MGVLRPVVPLVFNVAAAVPATVSVDPGESSPVLIVPARGLQGLQGIKGDTGDQGVPGDQGAQGVQGIQGVKGDPGAQGAQGVPSAPMPLYPLMGSNLGYISQPIGTIQTWHGNGCSRDAQFMPLPVPVPMTLLQITVSVHTAGDAGIWSMAVYGSDATGMMSGSPLWVSADQDATIGGLGNRSDVSLSLPMTTGMYWIAFGRRGYTTTYPQLNSPNENTYVVYSVTQHGQFPEAPGIVGVNPYSGTWPANPPWNQFSNAAFWYAIAATPL